MEFGKADLDDAAQLCELRMAYLHEDLGEISDEDADAMRKGLPDYFERRLGNDIFAYTARDGETIVAVALLLVKEMPMSPSFITGLTGTVLNVYTRPEYRHRGCAKRVMELLISDAAKMSLSRIELKATDDGYGLYKKLGFLNDTSEYHPMKLKIV